MSASPRRLDAREQAIWQDLLTVVVALPNLLDRQLERDASMSTFEYSVLSHLSAAPDQTMRLSTLAAQCLSSQPRMSKVMTRLERRGWVQRHIDPGNGRYTLATLMDAGQLQVDASVPDHLEHVRELVFDPLTAAQQLALGDALARVAGTLRDRLDSPTGVTVE